MNSSKNFFQGFLFMFDLCTVLFLKEVKVENKLSLYWEKIYLNIQKVFNAETTKKTK
jgi:hypothetical protein